MISKPSLLTFVWFFLVGCASDDDALVVYTALDRPFSESIFAEFTRDTGIAVRAVYDTESTKTLGLVQRIRAERSRPRCDVFWNNEVLHTIALKRDGLTEAVRPKGAEHYPAQYRDPEGHWYGFAARARVLLVNTDLVAEADRPESVDALADPRWKGRSGIAKPLFGTTASHIACLFATIGPEATQRWLDQIKANGVQVHSGNKGCAQAVAAGRNAFALTDTDDAMIEKEAGRPVAIAYADSAPGIEGTLYLPNTLAVVRGSKRVDKAVRLIEYLLSAPVEARLAAGPSAQIPLHTQGPGHARVRGPKQHRALEVDFERAAEFLDKAAEAVERFLR